MSLVTRCTACGTVFRVLPAQLAARGGRVRCGQCAAVFDGLTSLLTAEAVAAAGRAGGVLRTLRHAADRGVAATRGQRPGSRPARAGDCGTGTRPDRRASVR
ncbi:MAG: zinc-ribbon domain-containing protein [Betaproteobacteria bacterium]|nr:zinc-ribbon domain-containing protein [Betaproteobacteria bacterium]